VQNTIEEKIPVMDIIELTSDGNYLLEIFHSNISRVVENSRGSGDYCFLKL
jgi:hypothetical protein